MNEREPFSAPGFTRSGDGDAQPLAPEARKALFRAKLLAHTAGVPVWRTRTVHEPSGAVITTNLAGPIERAHVHYAPERPPVPVPGTPQGLVRLAWVPEGFIITPRSVAAPDGYGMPSTPDGKGTPGGPLREVIINRFPGNQYPDAIYAHYNGAALPLKSVVAANLFYFPWELDQLSGFAIGMMDQLGEEPVWRSQFPARDEVDLREPEGLTWLCHRPETTGLNGPFAATVLAGTNAVRASAGEPPLHPPLRGREYQLCTDVIYQIIYSGVFGHSSQTFRPGHWAFFNRAQLLDMWWGNYAENLAFNQGNVATSPVAVAQSMVDQWKNSAEHYSAMVSDWTLGGTAWPTLESSAGRARITEEQRPPYDPYQPNEAVVPPVVGTVAAQIFSGVAEWVAPNGGGYANTLVERIGSMPATVHMWNRFENRQSLYQTYKGRTVPICGPDSDLVSIYDRKFFVRDGELFMRVIASSREPAAQDVEKVTSIVVMEGPFTPVLTVPGEPPFFDEAAEVLHTYPMPMRSLEMTSPRFSASGDKAVFMYTVASPFEGPAFFWRTNPNFPDSEAEPQDYDFGADFENADAWMWGEEMFVIEWTLDGGFNQLGEPDTVMVTPAPKLTNVQQIGKSCTGTYRIAAAYDDEALVFATVTVDCSHFCQMREIASEVAPNFFKKVKGTLTFPNGNTFTFQDYELNQDGISGFTSLIQYMDILRPDDLVHQHIEMSGAYFPSAQATQHVGQLPQFLIGEMMGQYTGKDPMFSISRLSPANNWWDAFTRFGNSMTFNAWTFYYYLRVVGDAEADEFGPDVDLDLFVTYCTQGRFYVPAAPFRAMLWTSDAKGYNQTLLLGSKSEQWRARFHDNVGPRFAGPSAGPLETTVCHYKGERIIAGVTGSPMHQLYEHGEALNQARPFYHSTLNLPDITGVPDLKDNILPIGVL